MGSLIYNWSVRSTGDTLGLEIGIRNGCDLHFLLLVSELN